MAGGLDVLEELQKHPNMDIYNNAVNILTKYFDIDNDMEQDSLQQPAPQRRVEGGDAQQQN